MASPHPDLEAPMASIRDFWLGYGGEHRSVGDLTVFRSGLPDPQLNGVLRMRGGDLDEAIAAVTAGWDSPLWASTGSCSCPKGCQPDHGAARLGQ